MLAVLKGKHTEKTLELCHYKYRPDAPGVGNGPELVWFPSREHDEISQNDEHGYWMQQVPTDFVLFLKKDERGQLTFVTGQFDAKPSVRQIHDPLPPSMRPIVDAYDRWTSAGTITLLKIATSERTVRIVIIALAVLASVQSISSLCLNLHCFQAHACYWMENKEQLSYHCFFLSLCRFQRFSSGPS